LHRPVVDDRHAAIGVGVVSDPDGTAEARGGGDEGAEHDALRMVHGVRSDDGAEQ
jgi:hypothetical protein